MKTGLRQFSDYFKEQKEEFHRYSKKVHKNLDKESVHQLRLHIRRIRLLLWLIKNSTSKISVKRLDHKLDKLGEKVGKVRELQVAIDDAKNYGIKTAELKKRKRKPQKKLANELQKKEIKKLEDGVSSVMQKFSKQKNFSYSEALKKLSKRTSDWSGPLNGGTEELHQLRKDLKKVHYLLTAFEKKHGELELLLDSLGRVHDLEMLEELTGTKKVKLDYDRKNHIKKAAALKKTALQTASKELNQVWR